jgi:hypothetical protein
LVRAESKTPYHSGGGTTGDAGLLVEHLRELLMRCDGCFRSAFLLGCLLGSGLLAGGCAATAPLRAQIERDGKLLLQTGVYAGIGERDAALWRCLEGVPFRAAGPLPAAADDPHPLTLTGSLRVVVLVGPDPHFARRLTAPMDSLRLVRVPGTDDQWQIPADELERIGRAAGVLPWVEPWVVGVAVAGCALLGALAWLIRRRRRGQPAGANPS